MCSYCGCDAESVIAELMDEHETIGWLAGRIVLAIERGDRSLAEALGRDVEALFDHHAAKEEQGLFAQLAGAALAEDAVAGLEDDHESLRAALRGPVDATWTGPGGVLDHLLDHADREDTDLFPFALQLLPDAAWAEVGDVHGRLGAFSPATGADLEARAS